MSWQRAAAGAAAGRGRQPRESCAQGRGDSIPPGAVILPEPRGDARWDSGELCWGSEQPVLPSPPRVLAASGTAAGRSGAQPCAGLDAPLVSGCWVPGRNTPLRLPSALRAGKPEGTVVCCAAGLGFCALRGRAGETGELRRGGLRRGSAVPEQEEAELEGWWRKSPTEWMW